jgi:hypothetical protein
MERHLLALFLLVILSGCVIVRHSYQPERRRIDEPPQNTVITAYVGDTMLRQGERTEHDAIYLREEVKIGTLGGYTFTPGYYLKKEEDGNSEYYLPAGGPDSGQVIVSPMADPFQVIRIDKKSGQFCPVSVFNIQACTSRTNYEKKKYIVASPDSFQQTLIYSGKVGDKISVGYREFLGNLARPAFSNEVEYDLSESKIIGYEGARIEVVEATNQSIKYKVIQNFNRAE